MRTCSLKCGVVLTDTDFRVFLRPSAYQQLSRSAFPHARVAQGMREKQSENLKLCSSNRRAARTLEHSLAVMLGKPCASSPHACVCIFPRTSFTAYTCASVHNNLHNWVTVERRGKPCKSDPPAPQPFQLPPTCIESSALFAVIRQHSSLSIYIYIHIYIIQCNICYLKDVLLYVIDFRSYFKLNTI
jgi:hypothetical protein